jgi:hypothetical protein
VQTQKAGVQNQQGVFLMINFKNLIFRSSYQPIAVLALLVFLSQAVSQEVIKIRGFVYDFGTKAPMAGAKVELPKRGMSVTSDAKGYFLIDKSSSISSKKNLSPHLTQQCV